VGRDIPLPGRIIAVADAFDAMTSNRSYRKRMQVGSALEELKKGAGSQFDPDVVRAFLWVWKHENLAGLVRRSKRPPAAVPRPEAVETTRPAARNGLGRLASQARDRLLASVKACVGLRR
jgi:HD-GYP domain-containing protein (c-di-GMP phosphodiesterase class II)